MRAQRHAEIVGIHPVLGAPEPCHLIELRLEGNAPFDLDSLVQPDPKRAESDWQTLYDERVLVNGTWACASGSEVTVENELRIAFFLHHLSLSIPLHSSWGTLALPPQSPTPEHLREIEYEPPD